MRGSRAPCSLLVALTLLGSSAANASQSVSVRVRGSARLEATSSATKSGFELRGTLSDDAGKPVPNASLRVRLAGIDGTARLLPEGQSCAESEPALQAPLRNHEEALTRSDAAGRFCLRWPGEPPEGRLTVLFDDRSLLLDRAELSVETDRSPAFTLSFVSVPRSVSVEDAELVVVLESSSRRAEELPELPFELSWAAGSSTALSLARRSLKPGAAVRLTIPTRSLGGPGTGELRASLGEPGRQALVQVPLLLTARTELDAPPTATASPSGECELDVAVRFASGPVSSGSVEALQAGRTVGIAPVEDGQSRLNLTLAAASQATSIELRYLSAAPWWIPGPPRQVAISIAPPSLWRRLPWALGLVAVAAWLLAAWRRPPRAERPTRRGAPSALPQPTIAWLSPDPTTTGWTGRVRDAHDGSSIPGATLTIAPTAGGEITGSTDADGEFRMEAPAPTGPGVIRIHAPWHATLEQALPPPGRVEVALVTRRRWLLSRLIDWAGRRGPPFSVPNEPTPGELALVARRLERDDVARWASAVEVASFGPNPIGSEEEASVRSLEPSSERIQE